MAELERGCIWAQNLKLAGLVLAIALGYAAQCEAQGRPPLRQHTATQSQELALVDASARAGRNKVTIQTAGTRRVISANGVPEHRVGRFPNRGNPHRIQAQKYRFTVTTEPRKGKARALRLGELVGVAINGVPFDPAAAEFWRGRPDLGWQYEALGGAVPLGLDANFGHVQPSGAYHYHGLPVGLMRSLGWSRNGASPLIGYAADGFPIYALTANVGGKVAEMTSSYRLKPGKRPGNGPQGRHDGTFVQDFVFVRGAGALDECNGAHVTTAEYPNGTYAYFLTRSYPVIPRCLRGQPDPSFSHRRGGVRHGL